MLNFEFECMENQTMDVMLYSYTVNYEDGNSLDQGSSTRWPDLASGTVSFSPLC